VGRRGARLCRGVALQLGRHRDGDEWTPATVRDTTGAMLIAAIGILAIVTARSRAPARVPDQLLRMALLAGLALWAVRGSVWSGLALPVAICALAQEPPRRPAEADRGVPPTSGLVLAALAVALVVALPPVSRAIVPDAAARPKLTVGPVGRRRLVGGEPAARPDVQLPAVRLCLEFRLGPRISWRSTPASSCSRRSAGASTWPTRPDTGTPSGYLASGHRLRGDRRAPDAFADRAPGRFRTLAAGVLPRRRAGYVRMAPRTTARCPPRAR
jgi:hypothetical protein